MTHPCCSSLIALRTLVNSIWSCKLLKESTIEGTEATIGSAEGLVDTGIKFKRKEEAVSFLDIEFDKVKGVVKIPYLSFSNNLLSIFENLIAYERCNSAAGTFFTGYAFFMDDLINTSKDVQILRNSGIVKHRVGSDDELAKHFNQLAGGFFLQDQTTHLYSQRREINQYCKIRWHVWRANLMRDYFYNPWAGLAFAGSLLGLLLTIVQTIFTIYPNAQKGS